MGTHTNEKEPQEQNIQMNAGRKRCFELIKVNGKNRIVVDVW